MIPLINVSRQFQEMRNEILEAIDRVITSGQYVLGQEGSMFEKEVSDYLSSPYAVSVGNGTDALVLSLDALDIGPGDEVITTPFTFFASAEAISRVGATPVFVDIDPKTYTIDVSKIADKITSKTKAILPVHLFGQSCDMDKLMELADSYKLFVIEDACQAFGAEENGVKLGTIGDIGCFSFFPTKNLSTIGDGGLIVTKHEKLAKRLKQLRHHGSTKKYYHAEIGYNSRLDEIHAAILRISLAYIDAWNEERRQKAYGYDELAGVNGLQIPFRKPGHSHIYHLYCVEHAERDNLMAYLERNGVASGAYYPLPLHRQEVYKHLGYHLGDFPVAEEKASRLLALPMHPSLKAEEQQEVIRVLKAYRGNSL
ncbi:DegT/DnrJ/EryC1/StrS family aminotransferase [Ornithinibacillus contaminans]|uniref:DegT/DnrJ/EryC1/StrS family aminotransferase n=1 Tax=Ornithinibacillus contaminans TaxID=694055 RepID=UPI00064D9DCA